MFGNVFLMVDLGIKEFHGLQEACGTQKIKLKKFQKGHIFNNFLFVICSPIEIQIHSELCFQVSPYLFFLTFWKNVF